MEEQSQRLEIFKLWKYLEKFWIHCWDPVNLRIISGVAESKRLFGRRGNWISGIILLPQISRHENYFGENIIFVYASYKTKAILIFLVKQMFQHPIFFYNILRIYHLDFRSCSKYESICLSKLYSCHPHFWWKWRLKVS